MPGHVRTPRLGWIGCAVLLAAASCGVWVGDATAGGHGEPTPGIVLDGAFVPVHLPRAKAAFEAEQSAVDHAFASLGLRYRVKAAGALDLPGAVRAQGRSGVGEAAPVVLLPSPTALREWLEGEEADPTKGVFDPWFKQDQPRSSAWTGRAGMTMHFERRDTPGELPEVIATPWGTPEREVPITRTILQAGRYTSPRVDPEMSHRGLHGRHLGIVRTFAATDRAWGYGVFPREEPGQVLPKAEYGWAFAIAEANSLGRGEDDPLRETRPTPQTNTVACALVGPLWAGSVAPFIMPRPTARGDDANARTEAVVITGSMLDAGRGVVMVRAAATWSARTPDYEIDGDAANHERVLAVYLDQRVGSARLIEVLRALCGATGDGARPRDGSAAPGDVALIAELDARRGRSAGAAR